MTHIVQENQNNTAIAAFKKVVKKARGSSAKSKSKGNANDPVADAPLYVKLIVQWVRSKALFKVGLSEDDLPAALASALPGVQKLPGALEAEVLSQKNKNKNKQKKKR